jgi:hypothetical protein
LYPDPTELNKTYNLDDKQGFVILQLNNSASRAGREIIHAYFAMK